MCTAYYQQVDFTSAAREGQMVMVPAFRRYARFESVERAKNRYRFYVLRLQPDLFGNLALVRTWGRLGTVGTTRIVTANADADGQRLIDRLVHHRTLHGYRLVAAE